MILDFDIKKQAQKIDSFRVAKLYGMFDLNDEHLKLNITCSWFYKQIENS